MDEGILVSYPALILQGAVPGRDFETFYGPAGPYLTAAGFEVLGNHLWVERLVGLLGRIAIAGSIFMIAMLWGRRLGIALAIAAGMIMYPLGLAAYSLVLGLGAVLAGLAVAIAGSALRLTSRRRAALFAIAGFVSGTALLFRPDFLPVVILPVMPFIWDRRRAMRYAGGLLLAVVPLLFYLGVVGTDRLHLILRDLLASRSGRRLPIPSILSIEGQLLVATTAAMILFVVIGVMRMRQEESDMRARIDLSIGLVLVTCYPVIVNRADIAHIVPVAAVAISLFPILALPLLQERGAGRMGSVKGVVIGLVALFSALAFVHVALSGLREDARIVSGRERSFEVRTTAGRGFRVGSPSMARDLNRLLPVIERATKPGSSLFVGPSDLRRTNYNDSFVYYLLPKLRPSSFYLEVNPGTANRTGSSLATDLEKTSILLLTTRYDNWSEPNDSAKFGSIAPSEVVADHFCRIARSGTYAVLTRCR